MRNQSWSEVPRGAGGLITYGPNAWMRTGHCRRCVNGLGHTIRRNSAGRPAGVSLRNTGIRGLYEDEIAPGEKVFLRRQVRVRERAAVAREISEARGTDLDRA